MWLDTSQPCQTKNDIKGLAVYRCRTLIEEYKKRMGEGLDDPDYQPGLEV